MDRISQVILYSSRVMSREIGITSEEPSLCQSSVYSPSLLIGLDPGNLRVIRAFKQVAGKMLRRRDHDSLRGHLAKVSKAYFA